jgi:MFS transporter, ACS family, solute carrier family 17 (sodium-dependent inorganic phosphate cotransporter), member 5
MFVPGAQLGTIIEMVTSGLLAASPWGWPSIFYVAGTVCIIWAVLWIILGDSTPGTSKWISKEERKYIEMNAGSDELSSHVSLCIPVRIKTYIELKRW